MKSFLLGFLVASAVLAQGDNARNPFASDPKAAEAGRGSFRIFCAPCHGIKAEGGRGPDLTRGVYSAGDQDADLFRIIGQGASGTEMPGFATQLGDEGIWRMVSYIRSATRRDTEQVAGNAASGERLFWGKGGCGACHRIQNRGGRMGPDLTQIGRTRSLKYLRESVVAPNADITPGFNTITVVTRDGKKITGVQRGFDNFSAQLMDAQDNYFSFLKSDVTSIDRQFRSIMPDTYGKQLGAAEIDDMIAYMHGLGRGGAR
ncbi:MAG: c-type cytochrome [Bryobacteraceae bacterium]